MNFVLDDVVTMVDLVHHLHHFLHHDQVVLVSMNEIPPVLMAQKMIHLSRYQILLLINYKTKYIQI
jgi:hypothetical protein